MQPTIESLIAATGPLISLPEVSLRIHQMVDDPTVTSRELATAIARDPAITARLLQVANSPLYGVSTTIDTTARAVTLLGRRKVGEIILVSSASESLSHLTNELVSMGNFWYHSLLCAVAARIIAEQSPLLGAIVPEALFTAGLLHDIGQLVLFNQRPDLARTAIVISMEGPEEQEIQNAEQELFGFDHAQLGGALARHWQLPLQLVEAIEYHHAPHLAPTQRLAATFVHIANTLAYRAEVGTDSETIAPTISPESWATCQLDPAIARPTIETTRELVGKIRSVFFPDGE